MIDTELKRKAVVQEGEGVEFEVREAVPSILYLGRKFSREAINVTGPLVRAIHAGELNISLFPVSVLFASLI